MWFACLRRRQNPRGSAKLREQFGGSHEDFALFAPAKRIANVAIFEFGNQYQQLSQFDSQKLRSRESGKGFSVARLRPEGYDLRLVTDDSVYAIRL
jgi:hypothetical protein